MKETRKNKPDWGYIRFLFFIVGIISIAFVIILFGKVVFRDKFNPEEDVCDEVDDTYCPNEYKNGVYYLYPCTKDESEYKNRAGFEIQLSNRECIKWHPKTPCEKGDNDYILENITEREVYYETNYSAVINFTLNDNFNLIRSDKCAQLINRTVAFVGGNYSVPFCIKGYKEERRIKDIVKNVTCRKKSDCELNPQLADTNSDKCECLDYAQSTFYNDANCPPMITCESRFVGNATITHCPSCVTIYHQVYCIKAEERR